MAFDGNATFLLQVHVVEDLVLHFALRNGVGGLEQTVGESAFAVVDMGDDAEVADVFQGGEIVLGDVVVNKRKNTGSIVAARCFVF